MTQARISRVVEGDATLRMLSALDLPQTLAWRNHSDSRRWFHSTEVIAPEQHQSWFGNYLERDDDYMFIVELAGAARAQVAVYGIDRYDAMFGRLLVDPAVRGQGLGHRATLLCLRAAGDQLGLRRLVLEVKHDNAPARRAYERAGFVELGRDAAGVIQMQALLT